MHISNIISWILVPVAIVGSEACAASSEAGEALVASSDEPLTTEAELAFTFDEAVCQCHNFLGITGTEMSPPNAVEGIGTPCVSDSECQEISPELTCPDDAQPADYPDVGDPVQVTDARILCVNKFNNMQGSLLRGATTEAVPCEGLDVPQELRERCARTTTEINLLNQTIYEPSIMDKCLEALPGITPGVVLADGSRLPVEGSECASLCYSTVRLAPSVPKNCVIDDPSFAKCNQEVGKLSLEGFFDRERARHADRGLPESAAICPVIQARDTMEQGSYPSLPDGPITPQFLPRSSFACNWDSQDPNSTSLPRCLPEGGAQAFQNGCIDARAIGSDTDGLFVNEVTGVMAGFCRADFNYCLGNELRAKVESLTKPASSRQVRDELLRLARERFQMAATEYAGTILHVSNPGCTGGTDAENSECQRLQNGYDGVSTRRMADAVTQTAELLDREIRSTMASSDSLSVGQTPRNYTDAVWRESSADMGAEGARARALRLLAGDSGGLPVRKRNTALLNNIFVRRSGYAREWQSNSRASRALALMTRFGASIPASGDCSSCTGTDTTGCFGFQWQDPAFLTAIENALGDPRRWEEVVHDELNQLIIEQAALPDPSSEPLFDVFRITPEDIAAANELLLDLIHSFDVDYTVYPLEDSDGDVTTCARVALRFNGTTISQDVVGSRFVQSDLGFGLEQWVADTSEPVDTDVCGLNNPGNMYRVGLEVQRRKGAIGAMHILRVILHKLREVGEGESTLPWLRNASLTSALDLAREYAGPVWIDSATRQARSDAGMTAATCDPPSSGLDCADVVVYGVPELGTDAELVGVQTAVEVYCAMHGHYPSQSSDPSQTCALGFVNLTPSGSGFFQGVPFQSYVLHETPSYPFPIHLLLRRCEAGGTDCAAAEATYEYLTPLRAGVSYSLPLGGEMVQTFDDILAKDPKNPAAPGKNSLGFDTNFVPPVEHELITDSDQFEDSFRFYLDRARAAAAEVQASLAAARENERDALQRGRIDQFQQEESVLALEEVVSRICGGDAETSCEIEFQDEPLSLGVLVGLLPQDVPDVGYEDVATEPQNADFAACDEFLDPISMVEGFQLPSDSNEDANADYFKEYLTYALNCANWVTRRNIANTMVNKLPARVVDELLRGGDGEFPDSGGDIRRTYIAMFRNVDDLRLSLDHMNASLASALARVDSVSAELKTFDLKPAGLLAFTCAMKGVVIAAALVAGSAAVASATAGGGAVAIIAASSQVAGPLVAAAELPNQCTDEGAQNRSEAVAKSGLADAVTASDQLALNADEARRLVSAIASLDEDAQSLLREQAIARRRRDIQSNLIAANNVHNDPVWALLRGREAEQARQNLFRAQQLLFVARRAIEFRLGEDMRTMSRPEPFVEAPASWAGDVYTLDTLTTADRGPLGIGGGDPDVSVSIAGEAVDEYADKLDDFVFGYPFDRRFSTGTDVQVLNASQAAAPGTDPDSMAERPALFSQAECDLDADCACYADGICPLPGAEGLCEGVAECCCKTIQVPIVLRDQPVGERLRYKCFEDNVLRTLDEVETEQTDGDEQGCTIEYATINLFIPDELTGYAGDRLAVGNYNYRVRSVALNVVGRALIDCGAENVSRPEECFSDGNLQYSLQQSGAVSIENFAGDRTQFFPNAGRIEYARALASERVLTNPLSDADRSLLADYRRQELFGRPLAGNYALIIHARPEVVWENLEDIQLLIEYDYWTRQE